MRRINISNSIPAYCIALIVMLTGCSDWLDVEPKDKTLEETQFSREENIYNALNGLYMGMASENLYGGKLTMTDIEHMAHYYYAPANIDLLAGFRDFYDLQNYNYASTDVQQRFSYIWSEAYSLILQANVFINNMESNTVLTGKNRNIVIGEAYAVRAFLHFDLFRLFGPVPSLGLDKESLPYNDAAELQVRPNLAGSAFMEKVMADIRKAKELLADDPILEYGIVRFEEMSELPASQKFNICLRNRRLNLLAVEMLEARVLAYTGNKAGAAEKAAALITKTQNILSWTEDLTHVTTNSDYIFHSELLFAIENPALYSRWSDYTEGSELYNTYTVSAAHLMKNIFRSEQDNISELSDTRAKQWVVNTDVGSGYFVSRRYRRLTIKDDEYANLIRYAQPLMRISELHYIVAEAQIDQGDTGEAAGVFNNISRIRNKKEDEELAATSTSEELYTFLESEYYREFYGEGQVFFFLKRRAHEKIFNTSGIGYVTMDLSNYAVPLPLDETVN